MGFYFGQINSLDATYTVLAFIGVIIFVLLMDFLLGVIEHSLQSNPAYSQIFRVLYKEMMMMGLVSFLIVMYEALASLSEELLSAIDFSHILLFYTTIFFVLHACFLIGNSVYFARNYRIYASTKNEKLSDMITALKSNSCGRFFFNLRFIPVSSSQRILDYLIMHELFDSYFYLPENFDFAQYLSGSFVRFAMKIVNRSFITWVILLVVAVLNYCRAFTGFSCYIEAPESHDLHGTGRLLGEAGREESFSFSLLPTMSLYQTLLGEGGAVAGYHHRQLSENEHDCLASTVRYFYLGGLFLAVYTFLLLVISRIYKLRMISYTGVENAEDSAIFLSYLEQAAEQEQTRHYGKSYRYEIAELKELVGESLHFVEDEEDDEGHKYVARLLQQSYKQSCDLWQRLLLQLRVLAYACWHCWSRHQARRRRRRQGGEDDSFRIFGSSKKKEMADQEQEEGEGERQEAAAGEEEEETITPQQLLCLRPSSLTPSQRKIQKVRQLLAEEGEEEEGEEPENSHNLSSQRSLLQRQLSSGGTSMTARLKHRKDTVSAATKHRRDERKSSITDIPSWKRSSSTKNKEATARSGLMRLLCVRHHVQRTVSTPSRPGLLATHPSWSSWSRGGQSSSTSLPFSFLCPSVMPALPPSSNSSNNHSSSSRRRELVDLPPTEQTASGGPVVSSTRTVFGSSARSIYRHRLRQQPPVQHKRFRPKNVVANGETSLLRKLSGTGGREEDEEKEKEEEEEGGGIQLTKFHLIGFLQHKRRLQRKRERDERRIASEEKGEEAAVGDESEVEEGEGEKEEERGMAANGRLGELAHELFVQQDFNDLYLGRDPAHFFRAIEICITFLGLYMSLWITNFITLALEAHYAEPWEVLVELGLLLPFILVYVALMYIVETASLLESITEINPHVLHHVLSDMMETEELVLRIREEVLRRLIRKVEEFGHDMEEQELADRIFSEIDLDNSNWLDSDEFLLLLRKLRLKISSHQFRLFFRSLDVDLLGKISREQFSEFLFPTNDQKSQEIALRKIKNELRLKKDQVSELQRTIVGLERELVLAEEVMIVQRDQQRLEEEKCQEAEKQEQEEIFRHHHAVDVTVDKQLDSPSQKRQLSNQHTGKWHVDLYQEENGEGEIEDFGLSASDIGLEDDRSSLAD